MTTTTFFGRSSLSLSLPLSLFPSLPLSLSLPPLRLGWYFTGVRSVLCMNLHAFYCLSFPFSICTVCLLKKSGALISPHTLVGSQSNTHLSCSFFTSLALLLSPFSGGLCSVLRGTSRALSGCGSAGLSHCYSFGPGVFSQAQGAVFSPGPRWPQWFVQPLS